MLEAGANVSAGADVGATADGAAATIDGEGDGEGEGEDALRGVLEVEASCWRELARLCAAALELQGNPEGRLGNTSHHPPTTIPTSTQHPLPTIHTRYTPTGAGVDDLLPAHVLELQPPLDDTTDTSGGGDDPRWPGCGVARGLPQADKNMHPLRRAARASYVVADSVLGSDAFGKGPGGGGPEPEGRQQLLVARSVEARLGIVLRALRRRRRSIEAGMRDLTP